jgi:hypothetical protein
MFSWIGYIPIPRVESTDNAMDLVAETLILCNLFPNHRVDRGKRLIMFLPYSAIADRHHHEITLTPSRVQVKMRDVVFYFRRKTDLNG